MSSAGVVLPSLVQDFATVFGVPGLAAAGGALKELNTLVQNVKVYRLRCTTLKDGCYRLLLNIRDNESRLVGSDLQEATDQVQFLIEHSVRKTKEWSQLGLFASIMKQSEIRQGLDDLLAQLNTCYQQFQFKAAVSTLEWQTTERQIRAQDQDELRTALYKLLESQEEINRLQRMLPKEQDAFVGQAQEIYHAPGTSTPQERRDFQEELYELLGRSGTNGAPLIPDLTGVELTHLEPVASGAYTDVYKGLWLQSETVALRMSRRLNVSQKGQQKFKREVEIWRALQHPNVVRLYGTTRIDNRFYLVSQWQANGRASEWIKSDLSVNKVKLLREVATGMEYLHSQKIVHGDLRAANILISDTGVACISDFGWSEIIDELIHQQGDDEGPDDSESNERSVRWTAPELLHEDGSPNVSYASDVWSFGMMALEIVSGHRPFHGVNSERVGMRISMGKLPEPPHALAKFGALGETLWSLIQSCWHMHPEARPSMKELKEMLLKMDRSPSLDPVPLPETSPILSQPSTPLPLPTPPSNPVVPAMAPSSSPPHSARIRAPSSIAISVDTDSLESNSPSPASVDSPSKKSQRRPGTSESGIRTWGQALSPPSSSYYPELRLTPIAPVTLSFTPRVPTTPAVSITSPTPEPEPSRGPESRPSLDINGNVLVGTLDHLIHHLVHISEVNRPNVEYRDAFFTTHHAFTQSEEVLRSLIRQCKDAEGDESLPPDDRFLIRHTILEIFRYWLSSFPWEAPDKAMLADMRSFAISQQTGPPSNRIQKQIEEVVRSVDDHIKRLNGPLNSPRSSIRHAFMKPSKPSPTDLAIALTIVEGDDFRAINPRAISDHVNGVTSDAPEVIAKVRTTNNKLYYWVKSAVLKEKTSDKRRKIYVYFIETAEECRRIRNFSSMHAIVAGLGSLDRLKQTTQLREDHPAVRHLQQMTALTTPNDQHSAYKAALGTSDTGCIPILSVHLAQLVARTRLMPTFEDGSTRLIHFGKFIVLMREIRKLLRHQQHSRAWEKQRQNKAHLYLLHHLRRVQADETEQASLKVRLKEVEEEEERSDYMREPELRDLGFLS